ncbi:hypothetical protein BLNAU_24584 [Blattamonas nauphoetae]|uniref:Uncharacterized protein n=1 Tax=Blattamonas nauphoetae TaxID=2049346 RepID=A0ABQ9WM26_9EUKA|nr:hypothetical protein BLNAU_24584 [Blattamonas nauphoetae]
MAIDCILEEDSHPARRIRISYTINHLGQFQIQVLSIPALTSKPFNKTNIDILNYVQRTRQRIVDVPIIDNGETSPVYVRDVWVDYADGIIRRFILVRWDLNLKLSMAIDCILEEDSHPARRIRISYTINHLGQFQIQVLSIPALELKEEIHKAINTIPREERFEPRENHSRNDWDKYGLDNENCFIVFPDLSSRYGNTEKGGRICPLNVIYTPFEREKASITARTRKTSKPFNKSNIEHPESMFNEHANELLMFQSSIMEVRSPVYVRDFLGPTSASATGSLRHDYGRNERELLHRILEEDSHPARRIRISYTINHLGQFQIQVLSIPALELKEEIHKATNTIPREERFELVKTTLSRNDWDKYGLDNENCFIVFPIYPPRYGNTESLLKKSRTG